MIANLAKRLEALLGELDALAGACEDTEALEDLNAEFEDALMLLSEIDPREDGWREELADALEELRALAGDYRRTGIPGAEALADELEAATSGE